MSKRVAWSVAALCYPFLLRAFHAAVTPGEDASVLLASVVLILAISVPAVGIYVCVKLGALDQMTTSELLLKRLSLLSIAAAPL